MKTLANVWLLPTDKRSRICYLTQKGRDFNDLRLLEIEVPIILDSENFHLYITLPQSDLEISKIKEGDFYIDDTDTIRQAVTSDREYWGRRPEYEKIIATTDSSLNLNSIPQQFIKHYISEYNKGNVIKQIEVELDETNIADIDKTSIKWNYAIKLNQQNEISIIIPEEKMYNREEVIRLVKDSNEINSIISLIDVHNEIGTGLHGYEARENELLQYKTNQEFDVDKWIKENLK